MARCLIIGCGCRGLTLARALMREGHVVRGTTRKAERQSELEAAGVDPVVADPARVGTLVPALEHVAVVAILLGSAAGESEELAALHGPRLEALLTRMTDTTVRGVVYEASGTVPDAVLAAGADLLERFARRTNARTAVLHADPGLTGAWLDAAQTAVRGLLRGASGAEGGPSN